MILSRKDGSIIQSTGLLAASSPSSLGTSNTANTDNNLESSSPSRATVTSSSTDIASATLPPPESTVSVQLSTSSTQNNQQPYKPSQAETLAAHIFAFMTSASGLALSLSGSGSTPGNDETGYDSRAKGINGTLENGTTHDNSTDRAHEREEDDEIKLLRLRTKKNEIVVVPDRKYLLCVVHEASGAGATSSSSGGTSR